VQQAPRRAQRLAWPKTHGCGPDNVSMRIAIVSLCLATAVLGSCSPRLDWRQVQDEDTDLQFLLPCKPERATRSIALPGQRALALRMVGCETAGALFAVSLTELDDEATVAQIWAAWPQAVQKAMQAEGAQEAVFKTPGLMRADRLMQQKAKGQTADARPVQAEWMWVARGKRLVHMAIYAERLGPESSEPFWEGLKWP
jgi:hypothetical protein